MSQAIKELYLTSQEVLRWDETGAFLDKLGVVVDITRLVSLKLTFGTGENPVVVEHSYLAGGGVTPQPDSLQQPVQRDPKTNVEAAIRSFEESRKLRTESQAYQLPSSKNSEGI